MTSAYDTPFGDVVENLLPFGSVLKGESQRNTFFIFWQRIGVAGRSCVISNLKLTTSAGVCFNATKVEVIHKYEYKRNWKWRSWTRGIKMVRHVAAQNGIWSLVGNFGGVAPTSAMSHCVGTQHSTDFNGEHAGGARRSGR